MKRTKRRERSLTKLKEMLLLTFSFGTILDYGHYFSIHDQMVKYIPVYSSRKNVQLKVMNFSFFAYLFFF